MINFYADAYTINQGSCTTLRWDLEGIKAVYFQGTGTRWAALLADPDHPIHALYASVADRVPSGAEHGR